MNRFGIKLNNFWVLITILVLLILNTVISINSLVSIIPKTLEARNIMIDLEFRIERLEKEVNKDG